MQGYGNDSANDKDVKECAKYTKSWTKNSEITTKCEEKQLKIITTKLNNTFTEEIFFNFCSNLKN